ncbi:MAG: putative GTPase [Actinobacteria bacterium ADurb.Bin346]|nr:MAG: putative GTPase [Actinobacteria bacterium ADurb.Bin346]
MGDYVQTIKAGVLEIGDIFVINKIDKRDPSELLQNMESLLRHSSSAKSGWKQRVIPTSAMNSKGFDELVQAINEHRDYFNNYRKAIYLRHRAAQELRDEVYSYFVDFFKNKFGENEDLKKSVEEISSKKSDPYSASLKIIKMLNIYNK